MPATEQDIYVGKCYASYDGLHASLSLDIYSYNWVLLAWNYLLSLSLKKIGEMTKIRWIPYYYISMGADLEWDSENLLWAGFLCYILFILRES